MKLRPVVPFKLFQFPSTQKKSQPVRNRLNHRHCDDCDRPLNRNNSRSDHLCWECEDVRKPKR